MNRGVLVSLLVLGGSACSFSFDENNLGDLSVLGHENVATAHEAAARQEQAQFDAKAETVRQRCGHSRGPDSDLACWTVTSNPTVVHAQRAAQLRAVANQHRVAAETLKANESSACAGLDTADREHSPFERRDDIVAVTDLVSDEGVLRGASITLKAPPGRTRYDLERIAGCQIAENAAAGFVAPDRVFCPLDVAGASASVQVVPDGLRVDVLAYDPAAAAEIAKRAKALLAPPPAH